MSVIELFLKHSLKNNFRSRYWRIPSPAIYLLNASNGDSRDAFQAGNRPAARLDTNVRTQTLTRSPEANIGVMCAVAPKPGVLGAKSVIM